MTARRGRPIAWDIRGVVDVWSAFAKIGSDDAGAVALDWVMLTGASLLLGLVVVVSVGLPIPSLVAEISERMEARPDLRARATAKGAIVATAVVVRADLSEAERRLSVSAAERIDEDGSPEMSGSRSMSRDQMWLRFAPGPVLAAPSKDREAPSAIAGLP